MVRINLLPVRVSKKKEAGKQQLILFAVLIVAALLGNYLWSASRASDLRGREAKVARTRQDIQKLDRIIGEVRNIKEQQQNLQKKLDVLDKLKQGRTGPVRMLDDLAQITPRQLWLGKMEEKGNKVTFSGTAVTIDDVSEFMSALKVSKFFGDVELKKTTATGDAAKKERLVNFEIKATSKYNPLAAEEPAPAAPGRAAPARKG